MQIHVLVDDKGEVIATAPVPTAAVGEEQARMVAEPGQVLHRIEGPDTKDFEPDEWVRTIKALLPK